MTSSYGEQPKGFTHFYKGKIEEIKTDCQVVNPLHDRDYVDGRISLPANPYPDRKYVAVWDTGATRSCIHTKIVRDLSLNPVGVEVVSGVTGRRECHTYHLVIISPHDVPHYLEYVPALDMKDDVLIGMDVIIKGDFTLLKGNLFSYCYPSYRNPVKLGKRIAHHLSSQGFSGVVDGDVSQFCQ